MPPTLSPQTTPFYGGGQVLNPANVKQATSAPPSTLTQDAIGTITVDYVAGNIYGLAKKSGGVDTWVLLGGSSGAIASVLGTANQITVNTVGNTATVSLPAAITAPGSLTTTTTLTGGTGITATTGNIVASAGNINATLGSMSAGTTVTAGTGITATTGNIAASSGNVSASGTVTAGTGLIATTGGLLVSGGDIINSHSDAGTDVTIEVTNSDNTNGASRAGVEIATGGASSGDPYLSFQISGVGASTMTMGLDNSASDLFVISNSTAVGTSNALTLSQAGALTASTSITATLGNITATNGNVALSTAGNKLVIATGANASVGTSAAMSGTPGAVTVATTASSGTALIFFSRNVTGGTPGEVSITAQDGTGFTLTSTANETSTFNWWIINA